MRDSSWKSESLQSVLSPSRPGEHIVSAKKAAAESATSPPRESDSGIAILIPAYRPNRSLIDIVTALCTDNWQSITVIDDGSGPEYAAVFREISRLPKVNLIPHAVNLGKGSALKTGINAILCTHPDIAAVITADADGQHDPSDIRQVGARFRQSPESLVLGARNFEGYVPLRSRVGNAITRSVLRVLVGQQLSDSQTGLRAIPKSLLERLLKISSPGYEFELEMLLAVKHLGLSVVEQPIQTIYEPGNPSSHFHPIRDSMRIYFVLLRFAFIGAATAVLDNAVFSLSYKLAGSILEAQIVARLVAVLFNYSAIRKAVFLSEPLTACFFHVISVWRQRMPEFPI